MEYIVENEYSGKSVREVIRQRLGISMATLKHLKFLDNGIMLNGTRVTVRAVVRAGDILSLATEDTDIETKLTPCNLPLDIAYEDEFLVIPNKPADMPTHPSRDHYADTVANALAFRYGERGISFVFRPVNRLDRNTSGLVLIARDRLSANTLSSAMREHKIHKEYIAVLDGVLPCREGVIDTHIRRTAESIIVRECCDADGGGDRAITEYTVLLESNGCSVVCARPITGRTHQLRVHFAHMGCPIIGDDMYGTASPSIGRHALHSYKLSFPHPKSGESMTVSAALPTDMLKLLYDRFSLEMIGELRALVPSLFTD